MKIKELKELFNSIPSEFDENSVNIECHYKPKHWYDFGQGVVYVSSFTNIIKNGDTSNEGEKEILRGAHEDKEFRFIYYPDEYTSDRWNEWLEDKD